MRLNLQEGLTIYQVIADRERLALRDSAVERFSFEVMRDGLAPGHYKLPFIERFAPRTRHYGPGRVFVAELTSRDVRELISDEKATSTIDGHLRISDGVALPIIRLGDDAGVSIHGGGETLSRSMCVANFQPLTIPSHAIRMHNADLIKLMDFLDPRLRIAQLVVLTILSRS